MNAVLEAMVAGYLATMTPASHAATAPTAACFFAETKKQQVHPVVFLAVLQEEGGRHGQERINTNGTRDLGLSQSNTVHLNDISTMTGRPPADVARLMQHDGCSNLAVGAWILRSKINEANGNVWEGVARYHSKTPERGKPYAQRVYQRARALMSALKSEQPG